MKKIITLLFAFLCMTISCPAQNAKSILDKTAATFTQKGIIKASFTVKNFIGQKQHGETFSGSIILNGKKFRLNAQGIITWFDGKTQWTFVPENEEVNITEPTDEELQTINPYNFLNFYKNGYNAKMGNTKTFSGKEVYEVQLTAKKSNMDIKQVVVLVNKANSQLMQIKFRQGTNNWTNITVNSFAGNQKLPESTFKFEKKDAPNAEIIDLR